MSDPLTRKEGKYGTLQESGNTDNNLNRVSERGIQKT